MKIIIDDLDNLSFVSQYGVPFTLVPVDDPIAETRHDRRKNRCASDVWSLPPCENQRALGSVVCPRCSSAYELERQRDHAVRANTLLVKERDALKRRIDFAKRELNEPLD